MSASKKHWAAYGIPGLGCPNGGRPKMVGLATSGSGPLGRRQCPWARLPTWRPAGDDVLGNVRLREALGLIRDPWDRLSERRLAGDDGLGGVRLRGALGRARGSRARLHRGQPAMDDELDNARPQQQPTKRR